MCHAEVVITGNRSNWYHLNQQISSGIFHYQNDCLHCCNTLHHLFIHCLLHHQVYKQCIAVFCNFTTSSRSEVKEIIYPSNSLSPLFPADQSNVYDIFSGSMSDLNAVLAEIDVAMVMYYAPWCAHSQALANTFMNVARKVDNVSLKMLLR